jgi:hypothetical protein
VGIPAGVPVHIRPWAGRPMIPLIPPIPGSHASPATRRVQMNWTVRTRGALVWVWAGAPVRGPAVARGPPEVARRLAVVRVVAVVEVGAVVVMEAPMRLRTPPGWIIGVPGHTSTRGRWDYSSVSRVLKTQQ